MKNVMSTITYIYNNKGIFQLDGTDSWMITSSSDSNRIFGVLKSNYSPTLGTVFEIEVTDHDK